jgi:hypothetical protein
VIIVERWCKRADTSAVVLEDKEELKKYMTGVNDT